MDMRLRGHIGTKGSGCGKAIVCHEPFMFWNVDPKTGIVSSPGKEMDGQCVRGTVVVYPQGCGPTGYHLYQLRIAGSAPEGIITMNPYHHEIADAVLAKIPMVSGFDRNLLEIIRNGAQVFVDAENRTIEIRRIL